MSKGKLIATCAVGVSGIHYAKGDEITNANNRDASYLLAVGKATRQTIKDADAEAAAAKEAEEKGSSKKEEKADKAKK